MEKKFIYLVNIRNNITGHITSVAFGEEDSATIAYHNTLSPFLGNFSNMVTEVTTVPVEHINLSDDEKMLMHYFLGLAGGNTAEYSYYVIRKELN